MPSPQRIILTLSVAAAIVSLCGCTTQKQDGDTMIFSFAMWVPILVTLVGLGACAAGLVLRKTSRFGWPLIIAGPVALFIFAPALFLDGITVNDERFTTHGGFWFAPTKHNVEFRDVASMQILAEEEQARGGKRQVFFLLCQRKSGGSEKVSIGDLMKQGAIDLILQLARKKGIPVSGSF